MTTEAISHDTVWAVLARVRSCRKKLALGVVSHAETMHALDIADQAIDRMLGMFMPIYHGGFDAGVGYQEAFPKAVAQPAEDVPPPFVTPGPPVHAEEHHDVDAAAVVHTAEEKVGNDMDGLMDRLEAELRIDPAKDSEHGEETH